MKNQPFVRRLGYAVKGIRVAFATEASFRTQSLFAGAAALLLLIVRPAPIWWSLILMTTASVLAAELINTSLEQIVDRLHPEQHPMIARAKDCAAGAVLILSFASLGVAAAMLYDSFMR